MNTKERADNTTRLLTSYDYIIVGAGLSGCVIAERITKDDVSAKVLIIDKREHIAGNCYDYVDDMTGIRVNKYGAHLFHTNNEKAWNYVNQFSEWIRWDHRVVAYIDGNFVPVPCNISTVNAVCKENIVTEKEMREWIVTDGGASAEDGDNMPFANGEEVAIARVGKTLYNKIFKNYTYKQWGVTPDKLLPQVLARIPVYYNQDTRYFRDRWQALPKNGYTSFCANMINHPNIHVQLNCDWQDIVEQWKCMKKCTAPKIIFTGPIDLYFNGVAGKLTYRSLNFHHERFVYGDVCSIDMTNRLYYQPCSVVNYPEINIPYTRCVEYKHFPNQPDGASETIKRSCSTIIVKETSCEDGEPYYPVLTEENVNTYKAYQALAADAWEKDGVLFVGRLANFKYFNMDQAIANALDIYDTYLSPHVQDIQSSI